MTSWVNPEEVVLREIRQSRKDVHAMIPPMRHLNRQSRGTESSMVVARGSGKEKG